MSKDNGGPAFPLEHIPGGWRTQGEVADGMTLRDYFAAKAAQALAPQIDGENWATITASQAYILADAMLAERNK